MTRNQLFVRFLYAAFAVILLYGAGMIAVIIWGPPTIAARMVIGFSSMFSAMIGLATGFLLGKNGGG